MLAVASPPSQLLPLPEPAEFLLAGKWSNGTTGDLASIGRDGRVITLLNGDSDAWQASVESQLAAETVLGATTALLNGDAMEDLILQTADELLVFFSAGDGHWSAGPRLDYTGVVDAATHPRVRPVVGSLGSDWIQDVVFVLPQTGELAIFTGKPEQKWNAPITMSTGAEHPTAVVISDVVGDARGDLLVGHEDGSITILEGTGDGQFTRRPDLTFAMDAGPVRSMHVGDLDADGVPEVIVAAERGVRLLQPNPASRPTSTIRNGEFTEGLAGWQVDVSVPSEGLRTGEIQATSGFAELREHGSFLTSLSQTFIVPPQPQSLSFDLRALVLDSPVLGEIPDGFEVSLLDEQQRSLVTPFRADATAFASFGAATLTSSEVDIQGTTVSLDISAVQPGVEATLYFDLLGQPQGAGAMAAIDSVVLTSLQAAAGGPLQLVELPDSYTSISDTAIGDVDGDGQLDIVVADAGASAVYVLNGDGQLGFVREMLERQEVVSQVVLGPFTAADTILDMALAVDGDAFALTPLTADLSAPTAWLVDPHPDQPLQLDTEESAVDALGTITLQFSKTVLATTPEAVGSALNPSAYQLFHYGPNGVNDAGGGDDVVFSVQGVAYDSQADRLSLQIDTDQLVDPTQAAGSTYALLVAGADEQLGLRDPFGNRLANGQDVALEFELTRKVRHEHALPEQAMEGQLVTLSSELVHNSFTRQYRVHVAWGDGQTSEMVGDGSFPAQVLAASHVYADDGLFQVELVLTEDNVEFAREAFSIAVANTPPSLTAFMDLEGSAGVESQFELASFSDLGFDNSFAGTVESFTATIDWGDGTSPEPLALSADSGGPGLPTTGTVEAMHTYATPGVYQPRVTVHDDDGGQASVLAIVTISEGEPQSRCLPTIDFEFSARGEALQAGDTIEAQFAALGITISTLDPQQPAMIFDSAQPTGGDPDLGTPNGVFGGPGQGRGGESGVGANDQPLGNVLILSEDGLASDPDDDAQGGTLVFEFASPVKLAEVHLLDIETDQTVVRLYDQQGNELSRTHALPLGDNSFQVVSLDATGVARMEIAMAGSGAVAAVVSCREAVPPTAAPTRFFVIDQDLSTYRYSASGSFVSAFPTNQPLTPRGAATTGAGNPLWIVSEEGKWERVYVVDTHTQQVIGEWTARGLSNPQGVATDGQDIWIVDDGIDRVMRYAQAASRRTGSQVSAESFQLSKGNSRPRGITTDGEYLWVVDGSKDRIFVYDRQGNWVNWWNLDERNANPTGVTIATDGSEHLWVVDAADDRVYEYAQRTMTHQGSQTAVRYFDLASGNDRPQGIADPSQPIVIGDTISASLSAGETYDWTFAAEAGQEIYTVFSSLIGAEFFHNVGTVLYGPAGDVVYQTSGFRTFSHTSGPYVLQEPGSYVLQMHSDADIDFEFTLFDVPLPDRTGPIAFSQVYAGEVESPGVRDEYTFLGVAGSQLFFDAVSLQASATGGARVDVLDPNGSLVRSVTASRVFSLDHRVSLPADGEYTIVVSGVGPDTPQYSFQLVEIPPPEVRSLAYDETVSGSIERAGAVDQWVFAGAPGDNLFLDFLDIVGGDVNVLLEAPSGAVLADTNAALPDGHDGEFVLAESGDYTLTVQAAFNQAATPNYELKLWQIPEQRLQVGLLNAPLVGSLVPGEQQVFSIALEAGTELVLDAIDTAGEGLSLQLLAPDGSAITQRETSDQQLTVSEAGAYHISVQRVSDDVLALDNHGDFHFRLQDITYRPGGVADNLGTRFYVGFSRNLLPLFGGQPELTLAITSPVDTSGALILPGLNTFQTFDVVAGQATILDVSQVGTLLLNDQRGDKGAIVATLDEVAVYGLNQLNESTDAFTAMPVDVLGTEYRVLAYPNTVQLNGDGGSQLTIVGTADTTVVTITPSVSAGPHQAGQSFAVELDEGQVYQLYASAANANGGANMLDLTGTLVTATSPVAVYAGNTAAYVPAGYGAADHLVQQMVPVETWGTEFVVGGLATRAGGYSLRVLAHEDATEVRVNGMLETSLDAGEVWEAVYREGVSVTTSLPSLVAQFAPGATFDGAVGDPFMSLVPPVAQFQTAYTMTTPATGIDANFVNVIVPHAAVSTVRLDGQAVDTAAFAPIADSSYAVATLPVSVGSHHVSAAQPISAMLYGFDEFESYGTFGGMRFAPVADVANVRLQTVSQTAAVGSQVSIAAIVEDASGNGVAGIPVDFEIGGANPGQLFAFSDAAGIASVEYSGSIAGLDTVMATAVGRSDQGTVQWLAEPPAINVTSPAPAAQLPVGATVLTGAAQSPLPGAVIVAASVNGRPVDALDAYGNFFAAIDVADGPQSALVEVVDSLGQSAQHTVVFAGVEPSDPGDAAGLSAVFASASGVFTQPTFNRRSRQLLVNMQIAATSVDRLEAPVFARLDTLRAASAKLVDPDGATPEGLPWLTFDTELPRSGLLAGERSLPKRVAFENHALERLAPSFSLLAYRNTAPQFVSVPGLEARVGHEYVYAARAEDSQTETLRYRLIQGPQALSVQPASGELSWTPTASDVGSHAVVLLVEDGQGGQAQQRFTLLVADTGPNRPPRIASAPVVALASGTPYTYQLQAWDIDGDVLSYALLAAPPTMSIEPSTGLLTAPSLIDGAYAVGVQVADGQGGVATQEFVLEVGGVGQSAPRIVSQPVAQAVANRLYVYPMSVEDSTGSELTFRLLEGPDTMALDPDSGRVSWRPTVSDAGIATVRLQVTNALGGTSRQVFTIDTQALAPNLPPAFISEPGRVATVDDAYTYPLEAVDEDQQSLIYALVQAPIGMHLDSPSVGRVDWLPDVEQVGLHRVLVSVTDAQGAVAYQQFFVDVREANTAPVFVSQPVTELEVGTYYRYDAKAVDAADAITYRLLDAPGGAGGMQIDPRGGAITWQPGLAHVGEHAVTVQATDERGLSTEQGFVLRVQPDVRPPTLAIYATPSPAQLGEPVTITVQAADNVGVDNVQLMDGNRPLLLTDGQATLVSQEPRYVYLSATATDASGNASTSSTVLQIGEIIDSVPPTVEIESPGWSDPITYLTEVIATVTDDHLRSYELEFSRFGEHAWQTLARTEVSDGAAIDVISDPVGSFDPTLLPNDAYEIRLTATDVAGNSSSDVVLVSVQGGAKIGNFRLTRTDLEIPLAGIPIQINRVYDTLRADQSDDFGFGWSLDVASPRIRETVATSAAEAAGAGLFGARPFRLGTRVYLTSPDGQRVGFTFQPTVEPGLLGAIWRPRFVADPGVYHRLEVDDVPLSQSEDGTFQLYLTGFAYNPDAYTLTTKDQLRYHYDQFAEIALQSIQDRNGVQITFDESGIHSSLGTSIQWSRDALGRITEIVGPSGDAFHYQYSASGDLLEVVNPLGELTQHTYLSEPAHTLESIVDPRGVRTLALAFDEQGRVQAVGDALDQHTTRSYELEEQREVIADPLGNETVLIFDDRGNITESIDSRGARSLMSYDQADNLTAMVDANGHTTTYEYDARGNLTRTTRPDGLVTEVAYNLMNEVLSTSDSSGRTTLREYDELGNLIAFTNSLGDRTTSTLDSVGRPVQVVDPRGLATSYQYGAFAEADVVTYADGVVESTVRDAMGRALIFRDGKGDELQFTYDALGRVQQSVNGLGNSQRFQYDGPQLVSTTDALGRVTRYEFNGNSQLTKQIDPLGGVSQFTYDANGQRTSLTDALGRTQTWEYSDGLLMAYVDAAGQRTSYAYDGNGNTVAETRPNGGITRYEYDGLNRLVRVIDPLGGQQRLEYDTAGNVVSWTDARGGQSLSTYDHLNRLLSQTDPLGHEHRWTYDANGNVLAYTNPRGFATTHTYDDRDRLVASTDALGGTQSWVYDANGNVIRATDELGFATHFSYDADNQLIAETDALGGRTQYGYDAVGNLVRTLDALGHASTWEYDAKDRLIKAVDAVFAEEEWFYDAVDNLIAYQNANRHRWNYEYDQRDQLVRSTDPLGNRGEFAYDAVGNRTSHTDELGYVTHTTYDLLSRVVREVDPTGAATSYQYDANSNLVDVTDAQGGVERFVYDANDRILESVDANGNATYYAWDAGGNRTQVIDPLGNVSSFTFDALDRLIADTDPLGATRVYQYDAVGNLTETIDRNGRSVVRQYDGLRRLQSEQWLDLGNQVVNQAVFQYNAMGDLLAASDAHSAVAFSYDALGRTRSVSNVDSPGGVPLLRLTYAYDEVGNVASVTDQMGVGVWATFDNREQLQALSWQGLPSASPEVQMARDARGQLTQLDRFDRNGPAELVSGTSFQHDARGSLLEKRNHAADGAPISAYQYAYDTLGRVSQQFMNGRATDFVYDATSQLLSSQRTDGFSESFAYDASGNRVGDGETIGPGNRLLADTEHHFEYDAEGNLVRQTERSTGDYVVYTYDHRNRLISARDVAADGTIQKTVDYTYDLFGRRITRTVDGDGAGPGTAERWFTLYDGQHAWADFDEAGNVVARYLFGQQLDQILARWRAGDVDANSNGLAWYLTDHLGSVRDVLSGGGDLIDRIDYGSFGAILGESQPSAGDRFKFTGREWDAELGLYDYRSRFYSPERGRFQSVDPLGFAAGDTQLYRYVFNDPLNWTDPTGRVATGEYAEGTDYARVAVAAANGLTGFALGYACGYVEACTVMGLSGDAAQAHAMRAAAIAGAFDFALGYAFGGGSASAGARALQGIVASVGGALMVDELKDLEGPELYVRVGCTAVSIVGGLAPSRRFAAFLETPRGQRLAAVLRRLHTEELGALKLRIPNLRMLGKGSRKVEVGSTRHIGLEPAANGGYKVEFESGKGYAGKGGTNRARQSARRHSRANNDPVKDIDHFPADNDADAFDIEATFLDELGGPNSPRNYNQRNSPGTPF